MKNLFLILTVFVFFTGPSFAIDSLPDGFAFEKMQLTEVERKNPLNLPTTAMQYNDDQFLVGLKGGKVLRFDSSWNYLGEMYDGTGEIYGLYDYGLVDIEVVNSPDTKMNPVWIDGILYQNFLNLSASLLRDELHGADDEDVKPQTFSALFYYPIDPITHQVVTHTASAESTRQFWFGSYTGEGDSESCQMLIEKYRNGNYAIDCAGANSGAHGPGDIVVDENTIYWANGDGAGFESQGTSDPRALDALDPLSLNGKVLARNLDRTDSTRGTLLPIMREDGSFYTAQLIAMGQRSLYRASLVNIDGEMCLVSSDVGWALFEDAGNIACINSTVTNFGWPCYQGIQQNSEGTYATNQKCIDLYNGISLLPDHTPPALEVRHASGEGSLAMIGPIESDRFPNKYKGGYFTYDFSTGDIDLLRIVDGKKSLFEPFARNAPSFVHAFWDNEGAVYFVDVGLGVNVGNIYRLNTPDVIDTSEIVPEFTFLASPQPPFTVRFDASASRDSDVVGKIQSFRWNFGDNSEQMETTENVVSHIYNDSGRYVITLEVITVDGIVYMTEQEMWLREFSAEDFSRINYLDTEIIGEQYVLQPVCFVSSFELEKSDAPYRLFIEIINQDVGEGVNPVVQKYEWLITDALESEYASLLEELETNGAKDPVILRLLGQGATMKHEYCLEKPAIGEYNIQYGVLTTEESIIYDFDNDLFPDPFPIFPRGSGQPEIPEVVETPDPITEYGQCLDEGNGDNLGFYEKSPELSCWIDEIPDYGLCLWNEQFNEDGSKQGVSPATGIGCILDNDNILFGSDGSIFDCVYNPFANAAQVADTTCSVELEIVSSSSKKGFLGIGSSDSWILFFLSICTFFRARYGRNGINTGKNDFCRSGLISAPFTGGTFLYV